MTTPTRQNRRDEDLEYVEPSSGCYLIVTAKSGRQKCAYEDALDIILLSRAKPTSILTNRKRSAIVFELECCRLNVVRKMFLSRPSACISSVMVSRGRLRDPHEVPFAYLKRFSVHVREHSGAFGFQESRRKSPYSVEVFGDTAFVVRERWL
jgi:hypothetical protein